VLYSFCSQSGCVDGTSPNGGVIRDLAGNLYGTATGTEGSYGWGVAFKLDAAGEETVLHSFTGGADGGNPLAGLIQDLAGNLYGATEWGGSSCAGPPTEGVCGYGVVFSLTH